jgi:hypothetical protein
LQFAVIRQDFSCRCEHQFDPSFLLIPRERQIAVPFEHCTMAAVVLGVVAGPAENLAEPDRDILRMFGREGREHGSQQRVCSHCFVEPNRQRLEGWRSACRLKDRGSAH